MGRAESFPAMWLSLRSQSILGALEPGWHFRIVPTWEEGGGPFHSCISQVLDTGYPSGRVLTLGEAVKEGI